MAKLTIKRLITNVVNISADCALHIAEPYVHYDAWPNLEPGTQVFLPLHERLMNIVIALSSQSHEAGRD